MNHNKTVGSVDIKLNTSRLDKNLREAQKMLNMQVAADCQEMVPFQQGALRGSMYYPEGIFGGEIAWNTPYAHYQYEGELYLTKDGRSWAAEGEQKYPTGEPLIQKTAGTTDHWFERAKEQKGDQWVRLVRRIAGKG